MTRLALIAAFLGFSSGALAADPPNTIMIPPDAVGNQDAAGIALAETFAKFCLDHFPEPARIEDAAPGKLTPLSPAGVRSFLHDDPGRGWIYKADEGSYVVTVENPPFHTCAVRRNYAKQPGYRFAYLLSTGAWAAKQNRGNFVDGPTQTMPGDHSTIEGRVRQLGGENGDILMEFKTSYTDGHVEERLARRAMKR